MFVQHYLTNMFGKNKAEFLEQEMELDLRERGSKTGFGLRNWMGLERERKDVIVNGVGGRGKRVGDLSRLVGYLGGGSPPSDEIVMSGEF